MSGLHISPAARRRRLAPWAFLLPPLGLLAFFLAYPVGRSLWLSAHKAAGPAYLTWVGGGNYRYLLGDPLFWRALGNTVLYALVFVAAKLAIALLLALALDRPRQRGIAWVRIALFAPHLVGTVFAAVITGRLLNRQGGLNRALGLDLDWLGSPRLALWSVVVVGLWLAVGYAVVYLQAALRAVDRDLYEAATIDGAGAWRRFLAVTVPGIMPTLGLLTLVSLIGALQLFELPYILTGGPGPDNSTLTVGVYLFQQGFEAGNLGYAAAVGWALTVIVAALSLVQMRRGSWFSGGGR